MKKTLLKKIRNKAGESIAEVLVASLIFSLAFMMAAGLVESSVKITENSGDKLTDYYTARNEMEKGSNPVDADTIIITPDGTGTALKVQDVISASDSRYSVTEYKTVSGDVSLIRYTVEKKGS
jgi:hypothetical protein